MVNQKKKLKKVRVIGKGTMIVSKKIGGSRITGTYTVICTNAWIIPLSNN